MRPDLFHRKVVEVAAKYSDDPEQQHSELDKLMEEQLIYFGCRAAIEHIRRQTRWYA